MSLPDNISDIKAIVLDVDGVLTDGRIGYGAGSPDEIKFFDVRDGQGIRFLVQGSSEFTNLFDQFLRIMLYISTL